MTTHTAPNQTPPKKKRTGLIIGIVLAAIAILIAIFFIAGIALISTFKNSNLQIGVQDPSENTELMRSVESYPGVESASIGCSHPVPWQYQACQLEIGVVRTITQDEIRAVTVASLSSIKDVDFGSTPRGIQIKWGDKATSSAIESTAIFNTDTLESALPLFYRALQDPSISVLSAKDSEYVSATYKVSSINYAASCAAAKNYSSELRIIRIQQSTLPEVSLTNVLSEPEGLDTCEKLLRFTASYADKSDEISRISISKSSSRLYFERSATESTQTELNAAFSQLLADTPFAVSN